MGLDRAPVIDPAIAEEVVMLMLADTDVAGMERFRRFRYCRLPVAGCLLSVGLERDPPS